MKQAIYILSVLLLIAGCASVKKTHVERVSVTKDSVQNNVSNSADSVFEKLMTQVTDTVVSSAGAYADTTIDTAELKPLYTNTGKAVAHTIKINNGKAHGSITILPNGKAKIECACDSEKFVIQNLIRENDSLVHMQKSKQEKSLVVNNTSDKSVSDKVVKNRFSLKWFLIALGAGMLLIPICRWIIDLVKHWRS